MSVPTRHSPTAARLHPAKFIGGALLLAAATAASAQGIVVQARGSTAANVGPLMQLRVNDVPVGSVEVRSTAFADYSFNTGAVPAGAKVEVVFNNDHCCTNNADRNLYVQSIRVNGAVVASTDPGVVFDRGTDEGAFDELDTRPGLVGMMWNGALRFYAPAISGPTYYFSDCQTDAAQGCVNGNNANAGTSQAAPKQNLNGFNVNTLPAGTRLLFKRGGAWNHSTLRLDNRNTTAAAPLTFDAYGSGPAPLFRTVVNYAFEFGGWQNRDDDRGYVFRNLKLDGVGTGQWAFWLRGLIRDVLVDNVEVTRFYSAFELQGNDPISFLTVRNSKIVNNRGMGIIGTMNDSRIEGNLFEATGSGAPTVHAIYLSSGDRNLIRGNRFVRNSLTQGVCTGGNVTAHGQVDGLVIERNTILQDASSDTCYGISLMPGYDIAEGFRNVAVRNNTVINLGACGICVSMAPGAVIEGNRIIQDQARWHMGIFVRQTEQPNDLAGGGEIVRNNVGCYGLASTSASTMVTVQTAGAVVTGNVARTGANATTGACAR